MKTDFDSASFVVEQRAGRGRCVVARRQLPAGATVILEDPWAAALLTEGVGERCDILFCQADKLWLCPITGLAFMSQDQRALARDQYYENECTAAAAPATSSGSSRRDKPTLSTAMRLVVRALWRGARQGELPWTTFEDHWEDFPPERETELEAQARNCLDEFRRGFADGPNAYRDRIDLGIIIRLLAAVEINAMVVTDEEQRGLALGLYLRGAVFNHDDVPTCVQCFAGRRLLIRTLKPVAAGEELTIAYSELAEASSVRRARLRAQYFFDPMPKGFVLTEVVERDRVLSEVLEHAAPEGWRPLTEGVIWSQELGIHSGIGSNIAGVDSRHGGIRLAQHVHESWVAARKETKAGDLQKAAHRLRKAWEATSSTGFRLGDGHALKLAVAKDGMDAAIEAQLWDDAVMFARAVCVANRLIYPSPWPVTALSLAKLAKLELYHGRFVAATHASTESLRSLALVYHDEADIVNEVQQILAEARAEEQARSSHCREQQKLTAAPLAISARPAEHQTAALVVSSDCERLDLQSLD